MKSNKSIKIGIIFILTICLILAGNHISNGANLSSDINGINESKYPGIKSMIQSLQRKYGNYHFQVYYTGIDWTEAITMEYQGHGRSPKNLFQAKNNYKGKWHCPICGSKTYDTGWYCASVDAIKYMMDPRNSLDETSVYQFKNLETADVSSSNIQTVINSQYGSYAYINNPTAINAIVKASSTYQMNGYSILAKIINEQGRGTSPLVTGSGYNGQYVGYYNFFNVGAYGNGTSTVITNGLKYAQNKGWNSVEKSILGGSEYYKSQYIGKGQNTLYYQRFNVVNTNSLFSHQYQQDIMGAQTSAQLLKKYYTTTGTISSVNHTFIIPLYENMPTNACARPNPNENNQVELEDATVLTNRLAVRASPNSSRIISYLNKGEEIRVLNRATKKSSDGNYWDTIVTNTDGTYGYVIRSGISQAFKNTIPKYILDIQYYADQNPDLKVAYGYDEQLLVSHFIAYGIKEGRPSSPTFQLKYYVDTNPDLQKAFGNDYLSAYNHFANYGCQEYRRSSEEFDGTFYRYYYPDLTSSNSIQLMEHYLNTGRVEGRIAALDTFTESIVFDANLYASCNLDVRKAIGTNQNTLRIHWLQYGIREGRTASFIYDPMYYKLLNPDVQRIFGTDYKRIFEHFIQHGIHEIRRTSLLFDMSKYLSANGDVKKAFNTNYKQVYLHFKNHGIAEGRTASEVFDVKTYLASNADLKVTYGNNYPNTMVHFLNYGIKEKRKTSPTFSIIYYSSYADLKKIYGTRYFEYYVHYLVYGKDEGRKGI